MNQEVSYNFEQILSQFSIKGTTSEISPFGSGHINSTFYIKNSNPAYPDYLLQRINSYVFKDVAGLTNNILLVTNHLREKMVDDPDVEKKVLRQVPAKNGEYYHKDQEGNYWRLYHHLHNTKSYDLVETEHQAFEGGKAFGRFQSMLSDLDASLLIETIPDFLNIEFRLRNYNNALAKDELGRSAVCRSEIDYLNERAEQMCTILNLGRAGKLPLRITHNDTKFNNVLLNDKDEAQCVVDLDTVMPGYAAYDFGDAIRSIINTASEDEKDLSKINLNIDLFKAYTRGYLRETINFLTDHEIESLIHGVLLLPYMQTIRFLTDYLDGDKYYKIHFPEHNLQRTLAQLQLVKKLEESSDVLDSYIKQIASELRNA